MVVNPGLLGGFLALSVVLSLIPGPSVILSTSRAIIQGRWPAMLIVFGNALGGLVLLGAVVAGLGVVVTTVEPVFVAIKIAGAAYLLYLGIRSIISARTTSAESLFADAAAAGGYRSLRALRQGFTVGVSNPKSIASLVAILPQFTDPSLGSVTGQMIIIGLTGGAAQVLIEMFWVLTGSGLRNWFLRRPGRVKIMKASGGVAMIGLSVRLAVERSANVTR